MLRFYNILQLHVFTGVLLYKNRVFISYKHFLKKKTPLTCNIGPNQMFLNKRKMIQHLHNHKGHNKNGSGLMV